MLSELQITNLGVIAHSHLTFGPGMTAVTGETGAGKTMIVGAINLLMGGRAEGSFVRPGADEAVVEGRFVDGDEEIIIKRVIPRSGRSRAYLDGSMATVQALSERGANLVDLHGQHAHQSLLSGTVQRSQLDAFGRIDLSGLVECRADLRAIEAALTDLGGDPRERAREMDLYAFQVDELQAANLDDPEEEERISAVEDALADATAHRGAGQGALELLEVDGPVDSGLSNALSLLDERSPFTALVGQLHGVLAELEDLRQGLRATADQVTDDPAALADVRARRQLLVDLKRKYGANLAEVIAYRAEAESRLAELTSHDERAAELDRRLDAARLALVEAEVQVATARRAAAPGLARAVEAHLADLAMQKARFDVAVSGPAGDDVTFGLAANPGAPVLPLAKVASGGELARSMLAFRLVLTGAPPVLVFDEVDAGIGGEAAHAVGRALSELGSRHQVLVVTHLAQVAAFADQQVLVAKTDDGRTTSTAAEELDADRRVIELSRMLSGNPESDAARGHAEELLETASAERGTARKRTRPKPKRAPKKPATPKSGARAQAKQNNLAK